MASAQDVLDLLKVIIGLADGTDDSWDDSEEGEEEGDEDPENELSQTQDKYTKHTEQPSTNPSQAGQQGIY